MHLDLKEYVKEYEPPEAYAPELCDDLGEYTDTWEQFEIVALIVAALVFTLSLLLCMKLHDANLKNGIGIDGISERVISNFTSAAHDSAACLEESSLEQGGAFDSSDYSGVLFWVH